MPELARPPYPLEQQKEDESYILKKLDIDPAAWQRVLEAPPTPGRRVLLAAEAVQCRAAAAGPEGAGPHQAAPLYRQGMTNPTEKAAFATRKREHTGPREGDSANDA